MVFARELFNRFSPRVMKKKSKSGSIISGEIVEDGRLDNEDHTVNPNLRSWRRITTGRTGRYAFSGHAHVLIGSELYMFGGHSKDKPSESDVSSPGELYCFNMETSSWRVVKVYGEGPSPRASCTMCPGVHDGTFIVYGGQTESDVRDAYEFNVHDRRWRKLHLENAPPHLGSIYGHTTCLHKESLIFFGGTSGNSFWNDICSLNLFTMKYEAISTTGDAPSPRYKHQSQIVGNMMYVIGGGTFTTCSKEIDVFCLDLSTYTWMKISALGDLPPSRVAHSTAYDEHSRSIFLWGGNDGSKNRFQDFYTFNIDTCTWKEISQDSAHLPPPRAFHTSCFYEGSFYIFGGSNNNAFLSDAWYFPTRVTPPRLTTILANMIVDQASKDQNYLIHNF